MDKFFISFIIDNPNFYKLINEYITPADFEDNIHKLIYQSIQMLYNKYKTVPSRDGLKKFINDKLRTNIDIKKIERIYETINYEIDPRDSLLIKNDIIDFVKKKIYERLYTERAITAASKGDFEEINKIIEEAQRLDMIEDECVDYFSDENIRDIFQEEKVENLTSGFPALDLYLHNGGPIRGEVLCWLAPTGKGKSIVMANGGALLVKRGYDVLHISLEMNIHDNSVRYAGIFTEMNVHQRFNKDYQNKFLAILNERKNDNERGDLYLIEYPPDEISITIIENLLHNLKVSQNWKPDAIIIDYLELMKSRVMSYNETGNDYVKQKMISTELHNLAVKENLLIITASQTNRSGYSGLRDDMKIDLSHQAESFGKAMPMNYMISINQTKEQYESEPPIMEFYIAKNRHGPTGKTITARVDYGSFRVKTQNTI